MVGGPIASGSIDLGETLILSTNLDWVCSGLGLRPNHRGDHPLMRRTRPNGTKAQDRLLLSNGHRSQPSVTADIGIIGHLLPIMVFPSQCLQIQPPLLGATVLQRTTVGYVNSDQVRSECNSTLQYQLVRWGLPPLVNISSGHLLSNVGLLTGPNLTL
jgi:hypothetical protein